ncbi:MAG: hypothetical protein GY739_15060 [Mesoflavibacter sp.]|nr:hypothetical protein [Mesoflavibacter sp.]
MSKEIKLNGKMDNIKLGSPGKRNKTRCIRCGAHKKSEKYISCMNEYCDTDTLMDETFF